MQSHALYFLDIYHSVTTRSGATILTHHNSIHFLTNKEIFSLLDAITQPLITAPEHYWVKVNGATIFDNYEFIDEPPTQQ